MFLRKFFSPKVFPYWIISHSFPSSRVRISQLQMSHPGSVFINITCFSYNSKCLITSEKIVKIDKLNHVSYIDSSGHISIHFQDLLKIVTNLIYLRKLIFFDFFVFVKVYWKLLYLVCRRKQLHYSLEIVSIYQMLSH